MPCPILSTNQPISTNHVSSAGEQYIYGTMSHGLGLLHTLLFKVRNHEHLVTTLQQWLRPWEVHAADDEWAEDSQIMRRRKSPSERDLKERRRDPLPFRGDGEPDAEGTRPSLAWTLIWGGTYSNLYGAYCDEDLRRWGYVLWDATRLESTGATEVLLREWDMMWDGEDPRSSPTSPQVRRIGRWLPGTGPYI